MYLFVIKKEMNLKIKRFNINIVFFLQVVDMVKLRYVEDVFGFYVYYLWWFMYGKYLIF